MSQRRKKKKEIIFFQLFWGMFEYVSCLKRIIWRRWKAIWIKYHDFQEMHFQLQSSQTIYGISLWGCDICRFRVNFFFWGSMYYNQGNMGEMLVSPSIKSSTGGLRLDANQTVGLRSANEVAIIPNFPLDQYSRSILIWSFIQHALRGLVQYGTTCRGAFFAWRAPIVSWPRIMCSQVLKFLEPSREMS